MALSGPRFFRLGVSLSRACCGLDDLPQVSFHSRTDEPIASPRYYSCVPSLKLTRQYPLHLFPESVRACATITSARLAHDKLTEDKAKLELVAAKSILQNIAIRDVCSKLQNESTTRSTMPVDELVHMLEKQGVSPSPLEAKKVVDALHTSGVILKHKDFVYLDPQEVADRVLLALPDRDTAEVRIREIQEKLAPLTTKLEQMQREAQFRSSAVAWGGLMVLLAQFSVFIRLTYWELSWDVMEPCSYFTGQAAVISCYVYYLLTNKEFSYHSHFNSLRHKTKQRIGKQLEFDQQQYDRLSQDLVRWRRYANSPRL